VLLIIGLIHGILIWSGDILTLYALLGFPLLLLRRRSERFLLIGVFACLVFSVMMTLPGQEMEAFRQAYERATAFLRLPVPPGVSFAQGTYPEVVRLNLVDFLRANSRVIYFVGNVFGMFLLGLYVGKREIFKNIGQHLSLLRSGAALGVLIGVSLNIIYVWAAFRPDWIPTAYHRTIRVGARTFGAPALSLGYVSWIILLFHRKAWNDRLAPLSKVGRMALSNYLLHSLLGWALFSGYGLGLYGEVSPTVGLILSLFIFVAQIRVSGWWFERYRYGPAEWIWRTLTYGRFQPMQQGDVLSEDRGDGAAGQGKIRSLRGLLWIGMTLTLVVLTLGVVLRSQGENSGASETVLRYVIRVTATPARDPNGTSGSIEEGLDPGVVMTPVVNPAPYRPGAIAQTGDTRALAEAFDVEFAFQQIQALTSPPYLGRYAGSLEGWSAGEYIADQFAAFGLQPAGEGGTFFQSLPVVYTPLEAIPELVVERADGRQVADYVLYQDYAPVIRWYAGSGQAQGQVMWVNDCDSADFKGMDVVDWIVLCLTDGRSESIQIASRNAMEHGAGGLLLLTDPEARPPDFGDTFREMWVPEPLPTLRVYPALVDDLLAGSGKDRESLSVNGEPFPLRSRMSIQVQTASQEACGPAGCTGRNVLGVLPGRDPRYAHQVVIVGAHYDHLGQGPDGTVWAGANDNASGVATMLEIARSWQAEGYAPRRTVVFAAWDAEESGLLGSRQYVNHPSYPLEDTLAMVQLDMVGGGSDTLSISGERELADHLGAAADSFDVEAAITDLGRSDHTPFLRVGVPASLLIWFGEEGAPSYYHRPGDLPGEIELLKLERVGEVASLAILDLVESEPAVYDLLERRADALRRGDLNALLETSHPDQRNSDRNWFFDLQAFQPTQVDLTPTNLRVVGDLATALVNIRVTYPDPGTGDPRSMEGELNVQFQRHDSRWVWNGPELVWAEVRPEKVEAGEEKGLATDFLVALPPGLDLDRADLASASSERYQEITHLLGLSAAPTVHLMVLPDEESLRASTSFSMSPEADRWVSAGEIRIVHTESLSQSVRLETALVQLVLADAGVSRDALPWLWEGLPLILRAQDDPVETQLRYLHRLAENLEADTPPQNEASAWAAAAEFQRRYGWEGLGRLIRELGETCLAGGCRSDLQIDEVFRSATGFDAAAFEAAWRQDWKQRLDSVQFALDEVMAIRERAVLSGDRDAFLATVDPELPHLIAEQRDWFDKLGEGNVISFSLDARPLAFLGEGGVLAQVILEYHFQDEAGMSDKDQTPLRVSFTSQEDGYRWAGPLVEIVSSRTVEVRYPRGEGDVARGLLPLVEDMYGHLAAELKIDPLEKLVISLFDDDQSFRSSIGLGVSVRDGVDSWTGAGQSVRIRLSPSRDIEDYRSALAVGLARNLLAQSGVQSEWLLTGVGVYLSEPLDDGLAMDLAVAALPELVETLESGSIRKLANLPNPYRSSEALERLVRSQAWDSIRYLVENHGWEALLSILDVHSRGMAVDQALQASVGLSLEEFEAIWRASLAVGHGYPGGLQIVSAFDSDNAFEHVQFLASPELAGRRAGSSGAQAAASYIADHFAAYGLIPVGEAGEWGYDQTFPITESLSVEAPELALISGGGARSVAFTYPQDFITLMGVTGTNGEVAGELVWVRDRVDASLEGQEHPEVDLDGKMVIRWSPSDLETEVDWALERGARGLILVGDRRDPEEYMARDLSIPISRTVGGIPVLELTRPGYLRLLDAMGNSWEEMTDLPIIHPLGMSVRLNVEHSHPVRVDTANVLGLLPGSDPRLREEVIVLGAHYDHVGYGPPRRLCGKQGSRSNGEAGCIWLPPLRYSGANDNASGVGVLLELARLWHEMGYRPRRSILFAAWGAQEQGQLGSTYFLDHRPPEVGAIVAMIQLDGVGGGEGFTLGVQADRNRDGFPLFALEAAQALFGENIILTPPTVSSDHLPFREAGIPALLVSWRLARESNLPDDITNSVRPERLALTGRIVGLAVMTLAR
jgi:uncharacterized protein